MSAYLQKKLIGISAIAIIFLAVIFGLTIPAIHDIRTLSDRILHERAELEERYNHRINSKLAIQNLRKIKAELPPLLERTLSKRGEEIALITALEDIASSYSLEHVLRIEPALQASIRRGSPFVKIPLTLTLTGSFRDFLQYLDHLEGKYQMIHPSAITMNTADGQESKMLRIQIQAMSFWR